jgi:anti-sigma factor RsiW
MQCAEALRVQAYFDGEVDAVSAAEVERHIDSCAACRALLQDLEHTRATLRRDLPHFEAPARLRAQLSRALDEDSKESAAPRRPWAQAAFGARSFWAAALSGVAAGAIAATLAFVLLAAPSVDPLVNSLVGAHLRSLIPAHLIDVVSTDQHTVKPWLAGHADVSPVVADFATAGYRLIGGRADYLDHERSAVVVYQHGSHVINVFSWAADQRALPRNATRNGYHMAFWREGNLDYCAVSDTSWDSLLGLAHLLQ